MNTKKIVYNYFGSLMATIAIPIFIIYFLFLVAGFGDEKIAQLVQNPVLGIGTGTAVILLPVLLTVYCWKQKKGQMQSYINVSLIRYVVAFLLLYYGFAKMSDKFFEISYAALDTRLGDVDSFALTWFYFGKSNVQEFMIGLLEFIPALLLLFRRTILPATVLLLPVTLNVCMINVFNNIAGITRIVSFFTTLSVIYLLLGWWAQIVYFFRHIVSYKKMALGKNLNGVRILTKTFMIGTMLFVFIAMIVANRGSDQLSVGRNKIKGGFELTSLMVNDKQIDLEHPDVDFYKTIYLEPQSRWNTVLMMRDNRVAQPLNVQWGDKDSVITFVKKQHDVSRSEVDSSSGFRGTYSYKANKLYVNGRQCNNTICAVYVKKDVKEYNWFW